MASTGDLPYSFCKRYGVIAALSPVTGKLRLTLKNGAPANAVSEAQRMLGMIDEIAVESDVEFNRLLSQHFENNRETSFNEAEKIGGELNLDEVAAELSEPEDLLESDDDAPIIRLINALITEAIKENASDIHVEPFESRLSIRFRVDGVLREVLQTRRALAPLVRVNAVAPGLVNTPWTQPWPEARKRSSVESSLLQRMVEPEDVAETMLFLACASAVTGQTLAVDCGMGMA